MIGPRKQFLEAKIYAHVVVDLVKEAGTRCGVIVVPSVLPPDEGFGVCLASFNSGDHSK